MLPERGWVKDYAFHLMIKIPSSVISSVASLQALDNDATTRKVEQDGMEWDCTEMSLRQFTIPVLTRTLTGKQE